MRKITKDLIENFRIFLLNEEKATSTVDKYVHDISVFSEWLKENEFDKTVVLSYKQELILKYAPSSVNAVISSLNSFFSYMEWHEIRIKALKVQRQMFSSKDKELTKAEYERLLNAAKSKKNERLYYLMQTICSTGIRVSEIKYVTVEAIKCGKASISCKGKMRVVFLTKQLCELLKAYAKNNNIKSGSIFVTKNGKPLDRSNIWSEMKKLCESANVDKSKVFPHNFRHLFAITYYSLQKDIVRLADVLGHSNINTTRIYTIESGDTHRRQLQKLGLLRC
jgi:site-specific recombinase XerD